MKKIIITGGLGYIGSHVCVSLIEKGYGVVIVDNLENSSISVLEGIKKTTNLSPVFENLDLRNPKEIKVLFTKHSDCSGIIHFAAYKSVSESVKHPLKYYENNVSSLVYLLKHTVNQDIPFIFSSSCTVYGNADVIPISESSPSIKAVSPYGNTKQICEDIILDTSKAYSNFKSVILRYFNPIGAHSSGFIGESPNGIPQNLIPFITQTLIGKREQLLVFGNDYSTPDGTCVRDYIHVVDLADAHIKSLEYILNNSSTKPCDIFNIGTGKGSSVLEIINSFERITKNKLNFKIVERREGDVSSSYADASKANNVLGWKSKYTLDDSLKSAWKWELNSRFNRLAK